MKKYVIGLIALGCLAFAAVAIAAQSQTIDGKVLGKLDDKKFGKSGLKVRTTTGVEGNPDAQPSPANRAVLVFDKKDVRFDPDAVKGTCDKSQIENTPTAAAIAACKSAKVGSGDATAQLGSKSTGFVIPAVVTAFNGTPKGKNPTVLLHTAAPAAGTYKVLEGVLKKGKILEVDIPSLSGASITSFYTKVKKGGYVRGRCTDGKIPFKGTFYYDDGTSKTAKDKFKC